MTITLPDGSVYQASIASLIPTDQLVIQLTNEIRRLPDIAQIFDGVSEIIRQGKYLDDETYTGYSKLISIQRSSSKTVRIILTKEDED
jgi:hypothetical protein